MRLLICNDHRMFIEALSTILTDRGHTVVATAVDPDEAVDAVREYKPDVCLLDLSSPHGSGLRSIRKIREVSPDTKVVILSNSISSQLVTDAIAQGAQGLVGKDKPLAALIEALELAHEGRLAVDPLVLQSIIRPHAHSEDPLAALKFLTKREWEVLRCIVDGLTTEQMVDQLGVRPSTVNAHVRSLLTKLGVHSRLQVAALMTGHLSRGTRPHLGIAPAAADAERRVETVRMGPASLVATQGDIEVLLEALLQAVRGGVGSEPQLSAVPTTRDVASLSARGGSTTPRAKVTARLTPRELDVMRCLGEGLSGNQIGALLRVSPNTVRTHRRNILRKLNADTVAEAVAHARRA